MHLRPRLLPRAIALAALLAAGPVLSGCSGVVKNLDSAQVNVPNVTVANPFGLDKQAATVDLTNPVVGAARTAARTPHDANPNVYPFTKQTINLSSVASATLRISPKPVVTLTAANGGQAGAAPLPAHFTLTTFSVTAEADDLSAAAGGAVADRVTLPALATSGPVSFTQQPDGTYSADNPSAFQLAAVSIQGATLTSLINIITGEDQNKQVVVTLNGTSASVPGGTPMQITFDTTTLTVSAG